jgi:hypothetical protein
MRTKSRKRPKARWPKGKRGSWAYEWDAAVGIFRRGKRPGSGSLEAPERWDEVRDLHVVREKRGSSYQGGERIGEMPEPFSFSGQGLARRVLERLVRGPQT